uniref:Uncharacterized protein n=1 Tax=Desulfovibrio sp. U5L TaxID=596152 RepID=I2Q2F4_9BACT
MRPVVAGDCGPGLRHGGLPPHAGDESFLPRLSGHAIAAPLP